jgi:hypothetical protein
MTLQEQDQFRKEFTSIVQTKAVIKNISSHLRTMEYFDKAGSHENAISRDIGELGKYKDLLKSKLKGRTYNEWRDFSRRMYILRAYIKQAVNPAVINKWQTELDNLQFVTHPIVENL